MTVQDGTGESTCNCQYCVVCHASQCCVWIVPHVYEAHTWAHCLCGTHILAHHVCWSNRLASVGIRYFGHIPAHVHLEAKLGLAWKLCVDERISFHIIHSLVPCVPFTPAEYWKVYKYDYHYCKPSSTQRTILMSAIGLTAVHTSGTTYSIQESTTHITCASIFNNTREWPTMHLCLYWRITCRPPSIRYASEADSRSMEDLWWK